MYSQVSEQHRSIGKGKLLHITKFNVLIKSKFFYIKSLSLGEQIQAAVDVRQGGRRQVEPTLS